MFMVLGFCANRFLMASERGDENAEDKVFSGGLNSAKKLLVRITIEHGEIE